MHPKEIKKYLLEELYTSIDRLNQAVVRKDHNRVLEERALQRRLRIRFEKALEQE